MDKLSLNLTSSIETMFSRFKSASIRPINADGTTLLAGRRESHAHGIHADAASNQERCRYAWFGVSAAAVALMRGEPDCQFAVQHPQYQDRPIGHAVLRSPASAPCNCRASYNLADDWGRSNLLNFDLFKGLNILNATPDSTDAVTRRWA